MDSNVSTEELRSYHSIDRDLYTRLVVQLRRDPAQSLQIMAFWLLLEQLGCPSISFAVRTMSNTAVDAVFEEALAILHCMQSKTQPSSRNGVIAKTHHLTNKKITLQYVYERRVDILNGITIIISQVCARVLEDIIEETGRSQESVAQTLGMSIQLDECSAGGDQARPSQLKMPILPFIPHASHPAFHPSHRFEVGESSNAKTAEPPHDRTMFMTFSRGYPISEDELRAHLIRNYGDVVEQIQMEETRANIQPLYARVVFCSFFAVDQILNGRERFRFFIKGKHVWTRRYTTRQ